jgi:uncharacterized protein YqeY
MLKGDIQKDLNQAVKGKMEIASSTLRMLLAAISNREKEKKYKTKEEELTDEEVLEAIASEAKKRKEAIEAYSSGGRPELAEKEKKELEVLAKYLPEQLSEDEVRKIVAEAIKESGAETMKDMGKVMAQAMGKLKGRADGSLVSRIVKELLSQNGGGK